MKIYFVRLNLIIFLFEVLFKFFENNVVLLNVLVKFLNYWFDNNVYEIFL